MLAIATMFDVAGHQVQAKAKVGAVLLDRRYRIEDISIPGIQIPDTARSLCVTNGGDALVTVTVDFVTAASVVLRVPPGAGMVVPLRDTVEAVGLSPSGESTVRLVATR